MHWIRGHKALVPAAWLVIALAVLAFQTPDTPAQTNPTATKTSGGFIIILNTPTPTTGSIVIPPTKTHTPRVSATFTKPRPTSTFTPTLTPKSSPTPTVGEAVQPTESIGDLTLPEPSPTLPSFAALTPTPIIDVFHFPPGNFTGPIPTPTLPQLLAPGEIPDLEVTHIEVTQGLQNLANDMPLVAERMTFLRVYVKTDGADYPNVKLLVQGTHAGQDLGVLTADNQPILARGDGGDRINTNDSFYVQLPPNWVDAGDLDVEAYAYAGSPQAPFNEEPNAANNFYETSVEFEAGAPVKLSFVPIHLHVNYDGNQPEKLFTQSEPDFATIVVGMLRHLPLPGFDLYAPPMSEIYCYAMSGEAGVYAPGQVFGEHGDCEFNLNIPGGAQYVTVMMALQDMLTDDPTDNLIYFGMVDISFDPQMYFWNNQGNSIHYTGLALNGESYGEMDPTVNAASPWRIKGAETLAHELGHRYQLNHVLCAGSEDQGGSVDDNYPWPGPPPDCSLAAVDDEGYYGFDVWYMALPGTNQPTVISNDPSVSTPNLGFPLMGYQTPQYEDAYDWCLLLTAIGPECDLDSIIQAMAPASGPALVSLPLPHLSSRSLLDAAPSGFGGFQLQTVPFLVVTGLVQRDPLEASIGQVITLPQPPQDFHVYPEASTLDTGFVLDVLDANGQVLATSPIQETTINHASLDTIPFVTGLPRPSGAQSLEIRRQGEALARREFSQHVPEVTVTSPNGGETLQGPFEAHWTGSDEDGDNLTYAVQYSPDNGQTWQALALSVTGNAYQVLSLYDLTGSDQGLIRVLASDGSQTGSDVSDGTFSIPDSPPMPAIESPGHLAVFPVGGRVPLRASATDREDGQLPPATLTWESSVDGFLGTGNELDVTTLSPGNHVITLTAEDSQGVTAQAHVGIIVNPDWVRQVPGDDELTLASQILAAGPSYQPPAAPSGETEAPKSLLPLYVALGGAAVLGLIALGLFIPLLRGRRRKSGR